MTTISTFDEIIDTLKVFRGEVAINNFTQQEEPTTQQWIYTKYIKHFEHKQDEGATPDKWDILLFETLVRYNNNKTI